MQATKKDRTIHLIDGENLIGEPRPTIAEAKKLRDAYHAQAHVEDGDLVILAYNHGAGASFGYGWSDARHLWRSGKNGADSALLDVVEAEAVENRFTGIVIASGDGIFTEATIHLNECGLDTTVISRPEALSRRLAEAADEVVMFHSEAA